MKILQISAHYVPAYHYGGVLQVAHSLGKALRQNGHSVSVCTTNLENPKCDLNVPIDLPVDVDGIQVFYEPVLAIRRWGFSPRFIYRVWKEIALADITLIHFHYQFASLIGAIFCRLQQKPYIIFSHGSLNSHAVLAKSARRKRLYLQFLEQGNFRGALFTAYQSYEEREASFEFGKSFIVPNGIDPNDFVALPDYGDFRRQHQTISNKLLYLFLGRIDKGKGLDLLLPAFAKLRTQYPETHLVLAGGNEQGYETYVRQLIKELCLSEHVTLTGLVSGSTKMALLQDADIFVLPSRSEGLSIAMLEAMYMELPVIVTNRVGLSRKIQESGCGIVVEPQIDRLYEALVQAATAPDRASIGKRGRHIIHDNYTWSAISRQLVSLIQLEQQE